MSKHILIINHNIPTKIELRHDLVINDLIIIDNSENNDIDTKSSIQEIIESFDLDYEKVITETYDERIKQMMERNEIIEKTFIKDIPLQFVDYPVIISYPSNSTNKKRNIIQNKQQQRYNSRKHNY